MKTYITLILSTLITAMLLSGCSTLTDSIAASTQTFTNATEASSRLSSSKDSGHASLKTEQAREFARVNWMQLSENMAKGQGEYLSVMADLLEVKAAEKTAFYQMTKVKFQQLFPSTETTPEQLVARLKIEVAKLSKV